MARDLPLDILLLQEQTVNKRLKTIDFKEYTHQLAKSLPSLHHAFVRFRKSNRPRPDAFWEIVRDQSGEVTRMVNLSEDAGLKIIGASPFAASITRTDSLWCYECCPGRIAHDLDD